MKKYQKQLHRSVQHDINQLHIAQDKKQGYGTNLNKFVWQNSDMEKYWLKNRQKVLKNINFSQYGAVLAAVAVR